MKRNRFRGIRSAWLALGLASLLSMGCDDSSNSTTQMYATHAIAPSYAQLDAKALKKYMGPTIVDKGVNFVVYSEHATRIEILLFDDPESNLPTMRFPMTRQEGTNLWSIYIAGIGVGQHYGYIAWGPNWPYDPAFKPGTAKGFITDCDEQGNRFNPNKLLIDPYARRTHRDFDWTKGNPASGTARDISTWGAASKSVVIKSEYTWSDHETEWRQQRMSGNHKGHGINDAIYYEVHPKGFTAKALDVTAPGTFRGIGEKAAYLADLGITAVELMPVFEKPDDGTYWGYNTIAYFAPEQRFSYETKKINGPHDEFKWMVDQLHQHGIEVVLDIVYNHTGEGGFWRSRVQSSDFSYGDYANFDDKTAATIYSWRGLDNAAYYHLTTLDDNPKAGYLDQTGVGNQLRTNAEPFRSFIIDNLRFWVEEMHVDGFRFDLASILGVSDANPYADLNAWFNTVKNTVLQDIIDDEVLQKYNTRFIAEPWDVGHYAIGGFPQSNNKEGYAWSEWNGRFRDMMRRFVNNDDYTLSSQDSVPPNWEQKLSLGNMLTGSSELFGDDGRRPYNSVNLITVHDGFTLYDLVTYWNKQNDCGKLNPICCDQAYNAFCDRSSGEDHNDSRNWCATGSGDSYNQGYNTGSDGKCYDPSLEGLKRQMIRNFFALLMVSHGSPLILGGDEYMRTQLGNNNAYSDSADNEYNWFRWGDWTSSSANVRMHDFVRSLIKLRKDFRAFLAPTEYGASFDWWWPTGEENNWNGKAVAMSYSQTDDTPALFVIINMSTYDKKTFVLPEGEWKVRVDTQRFYDTSDFLSQQADTSRSYNVYYSDPATVTDAYEAQPRTVVILSK